MSDTQKSQQDEGEINFTGQENPNVAMAIEFMEKAKIDKKEMPRYKFRFIYYFLLPSFVFFLAGLFAAVMLYFSLQKQYQQKIIWFLPLIIWAAVATILFAIFYVWFGKIAKRIKEENLTELKDTYYDILFEQAEEELREKKIITQEGFCYFLPQSEEMMVCPFGQSLLNFNAVFFDGKIDIQIDLFDLFTEIWLTRYNFDNALHNFLRDSGVAFENKEIYDIFIEDKEKFYKLLSRYNNTEEVKRYLCEISLKS